MPSAATWVNLNVIILSKDSQIKRNILRYLLYVGSKRMIQMHLFTKTNNLQKQKRIYKNTDIENKLMVTKGRGEEINWN